MSSLVEFIWFTLLIFYFCFDYTLLISVSCIKTYSPQKNQELPLSVIIAAKNEAKNLSENLDLVLNQKYSTFEVIVVNDQSVDNTNSVLELLAKQHKHLKIIQIKKGGQSSKKNALSLGIKTARYEHLIFTDADCSPVSQYWLKNIQRHFTKKHMLILGFSPYQKQPGLLNTLIQFETLQTAINYFGFANLGMAYMGVGRNLAYTKSLYKIKNGFQSHKHLLSGDDDLFVNQVNQKNKVGLSINPDSFVESKPKARFKSWIEQKRRHITTASHYQLKHKLCLGFQYLTKVLFWFLAIPLTLYLTYISNFKILYVAILIVLLSIKTGLNWWVFKKFSNQNLWFSSYLWEIILIFNQFYIFTKNIISPKNNW